MTILILLALCGVVAKLWRDVGVLRDRVNLLEHATPVQSAALSIAARTAAAPAPTVTARVVRTAPSVPTGLPQGGIAPHPAGSEAAHPERVRPEPVEARHPAPDDTSPPTQKQPEAEAFTARAAARVPARPAFSFEDIFGRRLPIWAGGVTLAVCGFLIVKYSIDAGLLSPWVRVIGGLLFGTGLIAGAEAALRNEDRVRDPRVRQALAGAGVATLYASVLVAANLYALVPPLAAFGGLALVTVLAALLSVRFGPPSAVLGLAGGLAAPALVGTGEPNVPLLAGYLALAVGGLATLGRSQRWWWLGVAALVGGFGWGAVLLLQGALSIAGSLSVGGLLLLLGVGLPALLFGNGRGWIVRLLGTLAAAAQIAALVAIGGFALLDWGLFGLLGLSGVWLSRRERALADLPIPALAVALLLLFAWPAPASRDLALVLGGTALILGLPAAWRVWRADARLSDAATVAVLALTIVGLPLQHLALADRTLALLSLAGAGAAGGIAAFGWRVATRGADARFAVLTAAAATLLALAAAFGLPERAVAPGWAVIAAGLVLLAGRAGDGRVERFAWAAGVATVAAFLAMPGEARALGHAVGMGDRPILPLEALRWSIGGGAALVFARRGRLSGAAPVGAAAAVLLGYLAIAQLLPVALLPLVPAIGVAALGLFRRPTAATLTAAVLAAAWAGWPLARWLGGAGLALVGMPLFVTALPGLDDAATRLLAPALAGAVLLWRSPTADARIRRGLIAASGLLGGIAAHVAFKQLFALRNQTDFIVRGMAERTVWEMLLALAAAALVRRAPIAAGALGLAALAHLAWFTLVLHDPLWARQAVGAWPVANLLLPAYALGLALLWAAGRVPAPPPPADRARGWAQMALVLLFAASELRQLAHGSLLVGGGVSQAEDIARSVLAIAVAVGFLQWGIRRRKRDWRIGSLAVMLGAVLKVFLADTSGLDGLLRIASFAALGFSLIGIGWLYSRYLPDDRGLNQNTVLV